MFAPIATSNDNDNGSSTCLKWLNDRMVAVGGNIAGSLYKEEEAAEKDD